MENDLEIPRETARKMGGLVGGGHLTTNDPESVPAGRSVLYTRSFWSSKLELRADCIV